MEESTEDSEFELWLWDSRNTGQETNLRRPFFDFTTKQTISKTALQRMQLLPEPGHGPCGHAS